MSAFEKKSVNLRAVTTVGVLSALSAVLMFLSFSVPLIPSFIKFDFSELPALLASFAFGPLAGVIVCLVKNLFNLFFTTTAGVGELSNFILGCCFVVPADLIYKRKKSRSSALAGSLTGVATMTVIGYFTNLFIVYPFYFSAIMPEEAVLSAYQTILPSVDSIPAALLIFNVPFTCIKGLVNVIIAFLIYKKISPVLKGIH